MHGPRAALIFSTATLTGMLSALHGGTGLSSPGSSGRFLKSNGTAWTSVLLSSSDIPTGSGNYIQNTTVPQTASFNISGNGRRRRSREIPSSPSTTSNLVFFGQSRRTPVPG